MSRPASPGTGPSAPSLGGDAPAAEAGDVGSNAPDPLDMALADGTFTCKLPESETASAVGSAMDLASTAAPTHQKQGGEDSEDGSEREDDPDITFEEMFGIGWGPQQDELFPRRTQAEYRFAAEESYQKLLRELEARDHVTEHDASISKCFAGMLSPEELMEFTGLGMEQEEEELGLESFSARQVPVGHRINPHAYRSPFIPVSRTAMANMPVVSNVQCLHFPLTSEREGRRRLRIEPLPAEGGSHTYEVPQDRPPRQSGTHGAGATIPGTLHSPFNTIRWRTVIGPDGKPRVESNARTLEFSNGDIVLQVGSDLFQMERADAAGENHHLFGFNDDVLMHQLRLRDKFNLRALTDVRDNPNSTLEELKRKRQSDNTERVAAKVRRVHLSSAQQSAGKAAAAEKDREREYQFMWKLLYPPKKEEEEEEDEDEDAEAAAVAQIDPPPAKEPAPESAVPEPPSPSQSRRRRRRSRSEASPMPRLGSQLTGSSERPKRRKGTRGTDRSDTGASSDIGVPPSDVSMGVLTSVVAPSSAAPSIRRRPTSRATASEVGTAGPSDPGAGVAAAAPDTAPADLPQTQQPDTLAADGQ